MMCYLLRFYEGRKKAKLRTLTPSSQGLSYASVADAGVTSETSLIFQKDKEFERRLLV
jgi:hypothetical protein